LAGVMLLIDPAAGVDQRNAGVDAGLDNGRE
jgi:hypothetical protein